MENIRQLVKKDRDKIEQHKKAGMYEMEVIEGDDKKLHVGSMKLNFSKTQHYRDIRQNKKLAVLVKPGTENSRTTMEQHKT